jgi:hypothetical protein
MANNELTQVLTVIGTDLLEGVHWVENETGAALLNIWNGGKALFTQFEPTLVSDAFAAVTAFLPKAAAGGSLEDLEIAFLQDLEAEGSTLFTQIQALTSSNGSVLLQVILALAKTLLKL